MIPLILDPFYEIEFHSWVTILGGLVLVGASYYLYIMRDAESGATSYFSKSQVRLASVIGIAGLICFLFGGFGLLINLLIVSIAGFLWCSYYLVWGILKSLPRKKR